VTEPIIEVDHVSFGYPPLGLAAPVLRDVCLTIHGDDYLGVIGPNGGGKSTLLKIILGLLKPQSGEVRVFGESAVTGRRRVGYVPQHAKIDLGAPANVRDLVLMGRLARSRWGFLYSSRHVRVAMDCLAMTGVADLADRPLGALSGGQRQRVMIARALAAEAEVLLLDEPTAGVDPAAEQALIDLLARLNRELPIVMVSHDIAFVAAHLKRVACLNRTLNVHAAAAVTDEIIAATYAGHVRVKHHHHPGELCAVHPTVSTTSSVAPHPEDRNLAESIQRDARHAMNPEAAASSAEEALRAAQREASHR